MDIDLDITFERLAGAIERYTSGRRAIGVNPWKDNHGDPCVTPFAQDFMFMHEEGKTLWFKHVVTRNYVFLTSENRLGVPCTLKPFFRGYFALR